MATGVQDNLGRDAKRPDADNAGELDTGQPSSFLCPLDLPMDGLSGLSCGSPSCSRKVSAPSYGQTLEVLPCGLAGCLLRAGRDALRRGYLRPVLLVDLDDYEVDGQCLLRHFV